MLNIFVKFDDFSINIFCTISMAGIECYVNTSLIARLKKAKGFMLWRPVW
jgi:hypothetical protein